MQKICGVVLACAVIVGCSKTGTETAPAPGKPTPESKVVLMRSVAVHIMSNDHIVIEQGHEVLRLLGITSNDEPIVLAEYGRMPWFSLTVYLNRKSSLHGHLIRETRKDIVWDQESFENWTEKWKLVSGQKPAQKEFHWSGNYRTDGETIYFDGTNSDGSSCTWMLVTLAPRKS